MVLLSLNYLCFFSKSTILLMLFSFAVSDLQYSLPNPHFYEKIFRSGLTFFGSVLHLLCMKYIFVTNVNIHMFFILSGRQFPALAVPQSPAMLSSQAMAALVLQSSIYNTNLIVFISHYIFLNKLTFESLGNSIQRVCCGKNNLQQITEFLKLNAIIIA